MTRHYMICNECGVKMKLDREAKYDGLECSICGKAPWQIKDNKERAKQFLNKIAKMCDEEATAIIKTADPTDEKDSLDTMMMSMHIMNVFTQIKYAEAKLK